MGYSATAAILLLQFSVVSVFGQTPHYIQVPVNYATPEIQRPAAETVKIWNGSICVNDQNNYNGMTAIAYINLPTNLKWLPFLGVVYATVSNSSSFSPVLCKNFDGSTFRNSCSFTYEMAMGPNIYIEIKAGNEGHIQYSTGISFLNSKARLPPVTEAKLSPQDAAKMREAMAYSVPKVMDVQSLIPIVRLQETGTVPTATRIYYSFTVCPSSATGSKFDIEIIIMGAESDDAFSSYVCNKADCTAESTNVIQSDTSDSTLNVVRINYGRVAPTGTVYVLIVGFGGKAENQFDFGAVVRRAI